MYLQPPPSPVDRPRLTRALIIARRGSMKMVGCPKFAVLNRLSVANPSPAVSLSAFSTSSSNSTRPAPLIEIVLDTRRSSSDCDASRREPGGSSRMRCVGDSGLRQRHQRRRRPRLAAEVLKVGRDHDAGPRHVDAAHHAKHVRAIVRQAGRARW